MNEDTFDELLSRLMDFFPQTNDLELLTEAILQSECSLDLAIDYILAHSLGQDNGDDSDDVHGAGISISECSSTVQQLAQDFPRVNLDLLVAFAAAHEDEQDFEKLTNILMIQLDSQSDLFSRHYRQRRRTRFIPVANCTSFKIEDRQSRSPARPAAAREQGKLIERILNMLSEQLEDASDDLESQDAQNLRDSALEVHQERVELYRRAAEAHSRGGLTGTSSAQYFSSQGSLLKRRIDALNRSAAYITFRSFNPDVARDVIDLHGLTVAEALPIVDLICDALQQGLRP